MGTYGYAAPEYVSTGHLTTKSDVYSFRVVLLELITGRRAVEKSRSKNEQNLVDWAKPYLNRSQNLVDWAKPYLNRSRRLRYIMDQRLGAKYSVKGAKQMALLSLQCISLNPKDRQRMPAIIETLESLLQCKDMAVSCGQWPVSTKKIGPANCRAQSRPGSDRVQNKKTTSANSIPRKAV